MLLLWSWSNALCWRRRHIGKRLAFWKKMASVLAVCALGIRAKTAIGTWIAKIAARNILLFFTSVIKKRAQTQIHYREIQWTVHLSKCMHFWIQEAHQHSALKVWWESWRTMENSKISSCIQWLSRPECFKFYSSRFGDCLLWWWTVMLWSSWSVDLKIHVSKCNIIFDEKMAKWPY